MRMTLSILLPPLAGLAVFALVWAAPYLAGIRELSRPGIALGPLVAAWAIPIYPLVAVIHLPVFAAAQAWPSAAWALRPVLMLGVLSGCLALIGSAWGGVGTLIGAWPDWVALASAALVDTLVFLFLRPRTERPPDGA